MTTLELYRQLRAGQVSKDKFIYEVRKDSRIPWVTNLTSYEDSIKILKNKGIISEAYSIPQKEIYDPVELDVQQHRRVDGTYEKAIDMAAKENGMDPEKLKSLYSRADALGENPIDLNEYDENEHPSLSYFTPDEDTAYKLINLLPDWLQTELNGNAVDLIGISTRQMPSYLKRMNKFVTANMPEIAQTLIDLNSPEKRQQRLSAYKKNNKNYTNVTSLSEMDINDPILRRSAMMNESHKLTISQIIDRLSPYDFKIGLEFELNKEKDLRSVDLDKIKERVAKKLQKNPKAYRDTKHPDSKKAIKNDEKSKMVDVKEKNLKDKGNEMTKAKGQIVKANTKSSKAENKKGKPAGVKEMKPSNKTPKGVKKMEDPGKEKILESMIIQMLKKKGILKENYETPVKRDDYKSGQIVKVGENTIGKITKIQGSIIEYELEDESPGSITYNRLDSLNGINQHDDPHTNNKVSKVDLDNLWKDFDKRGEKTFGGMLTDPEHFKKPLDYKNLMEKIKNYLNKKKLKKEALVKINNRTVGNKTVITPNKQSTDAVTRSTGGKVIPGTENVTPIN